MQVWATPRLIALFHLLLQRFDVILGYKNVKLYVASRNVVFSVRAPHDQSCSYM